MFSIIWFLVKIAIIIAILAYIGFTLSDAHNAVGAIRHGISWFGAGWG